MMGRKKESGNTGGDKSKRPPKYLEDLSHILKYSIPVKCASMRSGMLSLLASQNNCC